MSEWTTLERGDINTSLMALKDCFRAHAAHRAATLTVVDEKRKRAATAGTATASAGVGQLRPTRPAAAAAAGGRMPFRAHRLTQVLKGCFTDPTHRTVGEARAFCVTTFVRAVFFTRRRNANRSHMHPRSKFKSFSSFNFFFFFFSLLPSLSSVYSSSSHRDVTRTTKTRP